MQLYLAHVQLYLRTELVHPEHCVSNIVGLLRGLSCEWTERVQSSRALSGTQTPPNNGGSVVLAVVVVTVVTVATGLSTCISQCHLYGPSMMLAR